MENWLESVHRKVLISKIVGALLVHSPLKGYADGLTDKHLILQRIDDSAIWRTLLMERCTYVSHLLLIDKYLG
jgi:hypothetical protein